MCESSDLLAQLLGSEVLQGVHLETGLIVGTLYVMHVNERSSWKYCSNRWRENAKAAGLSFRVQFLDFRSNETKRNELKYIAMGRGPRKVTRVVKSAEDSDEGDDRVVDGVSRCPPGLYLAEETACAFFFRRNYHASWAKALP